MSVERTITIIKCIDAPDGRFVAVHYFVQLDGQWFYEEHSMAEEDYDALGHYDHARIEKEFFAAERIHSSCGLCRWWLVAAPSLAPVA